MRHFKSSGLLFSLMLVTSCSSLPPDDSISESRYTSDSWKQQFAWLQDQEDTDFLLHVRRLDKAEELANQAILKANAFGKTDPRLARSLTSLGRSYLERSQFSKALPPLMEAYKIKSEKFGKNNADVADILTEIAYAHVRIGETEKAKEFLDQAVEIQERIHDKYAKIDSDYVAGLILEQENKLPEANSKYQSCIAELSSRMDYDGNSLSTEQIARMQDCLSRSILLTKTLSPNQDVKPIEKQFNNVVSWLVILAQK